MKSLKTKLPLNLLMLVIAISISCKKKTETTEPVTDSNNIAFAETTPTLGTLPYVAQARTSNILMAKRDAKIYAFVKTTAGGEFNVYGFSYDVNSNSFASLKSLATGSFISSTGFNSTLVALNSSANLWFAGPNISLNYSIGTDSWGSYLSSANAGANNGVCIIQDKVYYAGNNYTGGANASTMASYDFNCYDATKYTWSALAALNYLAENPALQPYNNRFIYAIGGEKTSNGGISRKFSVYDSQTNTWAALANLPFDYYASKNNHSTTILKNKYLLAYSNNRVYLYNLETKQWNNNPVLDMGQVILLTNINIFSNSSLNTDDGDAFYLAGTNIAGEFKIKKYSIK